MAKAPNSPDWRSGASDPARRPRHDWQKHGQSAAGVPSGRRRRMLRVISTAIGFFGILGLVLGLILWLRSPPRSHVVLVYARYAGNLALPHGEHYKGSVDRIAQSWNAASPHTSYFQPKSEPAKVEELKRELVWKDLLLQNLKAPGLIVYVAVHGGVDDKGPYLLPTDTEVYPADEAGEGMPGNRMRLDDLLAALADKQLESKAKLLILDCAQLTAHPALGMIQNDFVREVQRKVDEIRGKIPKLAVLCSSGPNQKSWESNELRSTFFAAALADALTGSGKEMLDEKSNRVTVRSVTKYVQRQVEASVRISRNAFQSPTLLMDGDNQGGALDLAAAGKSALATFELFRPGDDQLARIESEWKECERLGRLTPHPAVYQPEVWRKYLDSLLRAESLVRVGSGESDVYLQYSAACRKDLERKIQLKSTSASLALNRWFHATGSPEARESVDRFWKEELGLVQKSQSAAPRSSPTELYEEAMGRLLAENTADGTAAALKKAFVSVADRIAKEAPGIRPTEAHLAYMLGIDLSTTPQGVAAELVRKGLSVRMAAETALYNLGGGSTDYPYAERAFNAIALAVREGDQKRRLAEDLLFASDGLSQKKCGELLKSAETAYARAAELGGILRTAFSVRDSAAWQLPYFARWVVIRRDDKLSEELKAVSDAYALLHELEAVLERLEIIEDLGRPPADEPLNSREREAIAATSKQLSAILGRLRGDIEKKIAEYTAADLNNRILQEVEPALALPILPAAQRKSLLIRLADFYQNRLKGDVAVMTEAESAATEARIALQRAYRVGTMELAALGRRNFDDDAILVKADKEKDRSAKFSTMETNLDQIKSESTGADPQQTSENVRNHRLLVGLQLAMRYRALPAVVRDLAARARTSAAEREPAVRNTFRAARLSRLLDGAGARQLEDPKPDRSIEPAEMARNLQTSHLLLWAGLRAADDHWFDIDNAGGGDMPRRVPYFRPAANLYLEDAAGFARRWLGPVESATFFSSAFEQAKSRIAAEGLLALSAAQSGPAGPVPVTTQQAVSVDYEIKPGAGWVGGNVVATLTSRTPELLRPIENELSCKAIELPGESAIKGGTSMRSPFLEAAEREPPTTPTRRDASIMIDAIFRGQRPTAEVRFALHPLAESIKLRDSAPASQSLFVYADSELHKEFGLSNGAVVFVVDCSGSMKENYVAGDPSKGNRFEKVRSTMKAVLKRIPPGTRLSVWVYGNDRSFSRADGKFSEDPVPQPEDTIEPLQKQPYVWKGEGSDQFKELEEKINRLNPDGWTPLARAMAESKRDFAGVRGLKTLIVLTDGMDSTFEENPELLAWTDERGNKARKPGVVGDPKFNPTGKKNSIPRFLIEQFAGTDIVPYILGFQLNDKEKAEVERDFGSPIVDKRIGGRFIPIDNAEELIEQLRLLLTQEMRYRITQNNIVVKEFTDSLQPGDDARRVAIQGTKADWIPGLRSGRYGLSLSTNRENVLQKPVSLTASRHLLVKVQRDPQTDGLQFVRDILSNRYPPLERVESEGWRVAALSKQPTADGGSRALAVVEKIPDPREIELEFIHPKEVWIEGGEGSASGRSRSMRWRSIFDWPAPAWDLEWPGGGPADAKFQVWWDPKNTPYESNLQGVLKKGVDFEDASKLVEGQGGRRTVGSSAFMFEEIAFAERFVRVKSGEPPQKRPCLVIRVRHDPDDPVWIQGINVNGGNQFSGEEHRFFLEANSMTSFFWPATPDSPKEITTLSLISVRTFKKYCESFGGKAELTLSGDAQKEPPEFMRILSTPGSRPTVAKP